MTRKHFEAIAAILRANGAGHYLISALAGYLATTNPNFDRARFMRAAEQDDAA